jgi:hypothetical protein
MSDQQGDNPFAYYETQREELPDENSAILAKQKGILFWLGMAMIPPLLLTTLFMLLGSLHAFWIFFTDVELGLEGGNRILFLFQYLLLTIVPWLVTLIIMIGLYRGKCWAVNVGFVISLLMTLLTVCLLLIFSDLTTLALMVILCGCLIYNIIFNRVRIAISKLGDINEQEGLQQ